MEKEHHKNDTFAGKKKMESGNFFHDVIYVNFLS